MAKNDETEFRDLDNLLMAMLNAEDGAEETVAAAKAAEATAVAATAVAVRAAAAEGAAAAGGGVGGQEGVEGGRERWVWHDARCPVRRAWMGPRVVLWLEASAHRLRWKGSHDLPGRLNYVDFLSR